MTTADAREKYNARLLADLRADRDHPMHGRFTAYRAGCSCQRCKAANREHTAAYRRRRALDTAP